MLDFKALGFTEEQISAIQQEITEVGNKSKEGLFTQAELDRRINAVSQKHISDEKEMEKRIRKQIEEEAKLNAEEKAKKILEQAEAKEKELTIRENTSTIVDKFIAAGIAKDDIAELLPVIVTEDLEASTKRAESFITMQNNMTTKLKETLANQQPDPHKGGEKTVTKEVFDKMTISEMVAFKAENPDLAKQFMESK